MRIRTVLAILAVAVILTVARPASAQEKGATNFGVTYTSLTVFDSGTHVNFPLGWLASFGAGLNKKTAVVAEVGGNYKKETITVGGVSSDFWLKQHTFQGGLRLLSTKNEKMTPFFQVVTGVAHASGTNAWVLTPGGGVDAKFGKKCAVRIQGDWMYLRDSGLSSNGLRIGAGLVINMDKK